MLGVGLHVLQKFRHYEVPVELQGFAAVLVNFETGSAFGTRLREAVNGDITQADDGPVTLGSIPTQVSVGIHRCGDVNDLGRIYKILRGEILRSCGCSSHSGTEHTSARVHLEVGTTEEIVVHRSRGELESLNCSVTSERKFRISEGCGGERSEGERLPEKGNVLDFSPVLAV